MTALAVGAAGPTAAVAAVRVAPSGAVPALALTVVSVSPVYVTEAGDSVVFAELRNDDPTLTLSLAKSFAVTFYSASGAVLGTVAGAEAPGTGRLLAAGLRAVAPGQLGDVAARLSGRAAASARVTSAAAAASPYADPRLPTTGAAGRAVLDARTDLVFVDAVNTSGYPDRLHLLVVALDTADNLLGLASSQASAVSPSGATQHLGLAYRRLPGEPAADHYAVIVEGQPDGVAASSFTTPTTSDTPVVGVPATVSTRLLDGRGRGLAGQPVALQYRLPGRLPAPLAASVSTPNGTVVFTVALPLGAVLQAVFAGDATHAPAGTGDFAFRLRPRLTATAPPTATRRAGFTLRGTVPDLPREPVTVQERVHGQWRTVKSVRTDARGSYRIGLRPAAGLHTYRVVVAVTARSLAAAGDPVAVLVR